MSIDTHIIELISKMSLAEKVGQLFVFTWKNSQQAKNDLQFHPGGFIRIFSDALTVARETHEIQQLSRLPLIISADLERGIGGTISGALEVVTAMAVGATNDETAAYDAGHMIGLEASAIGFNMNYAPVLDVNSNPENPVINTRSFGSDPELVARMGLAFYRGLHDAGIAACGKHFPGHGNTNVDSHSHMGTISGDRAMLDKTELYPFRVLIDNGIDAIMSAHLTVPALEPSQLPATLSKTILTDILRGEFGFKGVIVSDALDMGAVTANFPAEIALPMAINAGCDQLIMPENNHQAVKILREAVETGKVSEQRLDEAVGRILHLKKSRGILDHLGNGIENISTKISVPSHINRALEIAKSSITHFGSRPLIPLNPEKEICVVSMGSFTNERAVFLEPHSFPAYMEAVGFKINAYQSTLRNGRFQSNFSGNETDIEDETVVIAIYTSIQLRSGRIGLPSEIHDAVNEILGFNKSVILVSFGSPYILKDFPNAFARICAYGATQPSQKAVAMALRGEFQCTGTLPVRLSD